MKSISIVCMTLTLLCAVSALGQGVPRVLDYQGKLTNSSGQPVSDGAYQVTFKFYFVETGGSPTWTSSTISVNTSGGIFTTSIASIPASVFSSSNVWLETVWGGETLAPRVKFTSVPYAFRAGDAWSLGGNSGTNPGANFLGTTDNNALELKVSNVRALRLEPHENSPNVIAGPANNAVTLGVYGATISGGGDSRYGNTLNLVTDIFGTIGGGSSNQAGDDAGTTLDAGFATVGGGAGNKAVKQYSTVAGGMANNSGGAFSTIGGGSGNKSNGDASTVGGGFMNEATAYRSTIAGGDTNKATDTYATVGGGKSNDSSGYASSTSGGQSNTATGNWSTLGGGESNTAGGDASTVGGGRSNQASSSESTVGGGADNIASGYRAAIAGGGANRATGAYAIIPGGFDNQAAGDRSFAAGRRAKANHQGAFVWGDSMDADFTSTGSDQFLIRASGGVGIAANDPQSPLDVNGIIRSRSGGFKFPDGTVQTTAGGDLADGSVTSAKLALDVASLAKVSGGVMTSSGGNVGIGTSTPGFPLAFPDTAGDKISLWGLPGTDLNYGLGIQNALLQVYTGWPGADIAFGYGSSANFTETMRVKGTGNVGIGRPDPATPLSFADILGDKISFYGGGDNRYGIGMQGALLQAYTSAIGEDIAFGYGSSASFTETMRVKGNGRVGIGTSTPGFPLTFADTLGDKISLWSQTGTSMGFGIQGALLQIHTAIANEDIAFGYGGSAAMTETMRIKGTGNVGIGTADPQTTLDVNGIIRSRSGGFKFPDDSVQTTAGGVADGSVTTAKLADGAVTSGKLASDAASLSKVSGGAMTSSGGNLGIGTASPVAPLSFANTIGDKISLYGGSGNRFGLGIQGGLLQIYTSASPEDIAFGYGSSSLFAEKMRIKGTGNVGIGTADPQTTLDVNGLIRSRSGGFKFPDGTVQITAVTAAGPAWGLTGNAGTNPASNFIGTTDNKPLEFKVNNTRGFRLEPASFTPNIIGGYSGNTVTAGVYGATISGGGVDFGPNSVTSSFGTVGGGVGNSASGDDATVGGGGVNSASGNDATVGGGGANTASGNYATVGGGSENQAVGFAAMIPGGEANTASGRSSFAAGFLAQAKHDGSFVWSDRSGSWFGSTQANQFLIRASGGIGIMSGFVGIGRTDPATPLSFSDSLGDKISFYGGTGNRYGIGVQGSLLQIYTSDSPEDIGFGYGRSGDFHETMRIKGNGNVGIGTSTPGYKLHVNGSAGKPGGGSWSDSSDERLKHNIEPLTGALDRLLGLRGVTYEWNNPEEHGNFTGPQIGMIAQEVEQVFPGWIGEDDKGFKTLTFRGFESLAVEALREQQSQIQAQQKTIDEQWKMIEELQAGIAEMDAIKARLAALEAKTTTD